MTTPSTCLDGATVRPIKGTSVGDQTTVQALADANTPCATSSGPQTAVKGRIKNGPGVVTCVTVANKSVDGAFANGFYFVLCDDATAAGPPNATAALWSIWVPANGDAHVSFDTPNQQKCATGIGYACSSTPGVVTAIGALTGVVYVRFN